MLKAIERLPEGSAIAADEVIELTYDERKRGRLKARTLSGTSVGLFLERGKCLLDGEFLRTETGIIISIAAAKEEVVTAYAQSPLQFAQVAYHLGNRHVPLQIGDFWVRFQPDHVLQDLCVHFGMEISTETAPFQPENGAYGAHSGPHGHSHAHDDHDHGHHHEVNDA